MCFSAEASFTASALLTIGGIVTLRAVKSREAWPLALIPLIFAFHQAVEGGLWLIHDHGGPVWLNSLLTHTFPFIAYVVWPTYVPWAVYRLEPQPVRKQLIMSCLVVGVAVSLFYFYYLMSGPVTAQFVNNQTSIHYDFYFSFWILIQWLYGYSIVMATLFSSQRIILLFGIGLVISYNVAKQLFLASYPSAFCFFAAWLSLIIYLHISRPLESSTAVHAS